MSEGTSGPKSPKSLKKVSRGLRPRGPQKSGKSLKKVRKVWPEGPGDFYQSFWGFRARRARETPVARRRVRNLLPTAKGKTLVHPKITLAKIPLAQRMIFFPELSVFVGQGSHGMFALALSCPPVLGPS